MAVGAMRAKVELQAYSRSADGGGGSALTWAKVASVWADIQPQSASENMFGRDNQLREVSSYKIYIRYRRNVTAKNRLVQTYRDDGVTYTRTFNIKGVIDPDNRRKYLELTCEEGVPT
jgi:SPP1 family predicted phage head-tail adaptor